jgi:hypothetical protein
MGPMLRVFLGLTDASQVMRRWIKVYMMLALGYSSINCIVPKK